MGLPTLLCKDKVSMLCGGRHQLYRKMLEDLLERLSSVADLEFFKDGPTPIVKFSEWIRRRNDKYKNSIKIIEEISLGRPLQEIIDNSYNLTRDLKNQSIMRVVRKFGNLTIAVTKECDAELVRFASNKSSVLSSRAC